MKTIKLLLLALVLSSCSAEQLEDQEQTIVEDGVNFTITCPTNKQSSEHWTVLCSGDGNTVTTNGITFRINGKLCTETEANNACK